MSVTGEEVKQAVLKAGLEQIFCRDCSICGFRMYYLVHPETQDLYYDASCDCSRYGSPPRHVGWSSAADWINMQNKLEIVEELKQRFGFPALMTAADLGGVA